MANENLFEEVNNDRSNPQSYVDKYVGEGKKYKSVEELAKAYEHADAYIPKLTDELGGLKEFMTAQFEQMNEKRQERQQNPLDNPNDRADERQPAPDARPKEEKNEDIDARILKIMEERDSTNRAKQNAQLAEDVMTKHFGSREDAVKAVRNKADELGVTPQFLADMAYNSPKGLFNLMGVDPEKAPRSSNTPSPSSDVNPMVLDRVNPGAKPGTYEYYNNLRRTDPKKYNSPAVQADIMRAAQEDPDKFFSRK